MSSLGYIDRKRYRKRRRSIGGSLNIPKRTEPYIPFVPRGFDRRDAMVNTVDDMLNGNRGYGRRPPRNETSTTETQTEPRPEPRREPNPPNRQPEYDDEDEDEEREGWDEFIGRQFDRTAMRLGGKGLYYTGKGLYWTGRGMDMALRGSINVANFIAEQSRNRKSIQKRVAEGEDGDDDDETFDPDARGSNEPAPPAPEAEENDEEEDYDLSPEEMERWRENFNRTYGYRD